MKITAPVTDYIRASIMTVKGDLAVRGAAAPERLAVGLEGRVLTAKGAVPFPFWESLFDLLTTEGDMWIRGPSWHQRFAAGALDTYFKAQGAGNLPIYEKLALRDTGTKISTTTRSGVGNQVITGVGFTPSIVIFFTSIAGSAEDIWSIGFDNNGEKVCLFCDHNSAISLVPNASMYGYVGAANYQYGYISAVSSDGFTITWVVNGAAITMNIGYLCIP